ncbi:hypothetical protein FRC01_012628, partial [Tulasnella sp. 417]
MSTPSRQKPLPNQGGDRILMEATTLTRSDSPTGTTSAVSPTNIHTLPIELLNSIFLDLYTDPSIPRATDDLRNTHKLAFIMLVCKHWKGIVECNPILWTDIWLGQGPDHFDDKDDWIGWLDAWFKRSGTLPLTLTIMLSLVGPSDLSQVLLQHLPRCETLVFEDPGGQIDWGPGMDRPRPRVSVIHHILSSPLPTLQEIVIGGMNFQYELDHQGPLLLDAPNLRFLTSSSPYLIPFVKVHGSPPAH